MSEVNTILGSLPRYKGEKRLIKSQQDTYDIVDQILQKHYETQPQYDKIALYHWQGDGPRSARELYRFLKRNAPYRVEPTKTQSTKGPAAILQEAHTFGNDCKHYASYAVGVGEALARRGLPVRAFFRFASYNKNKNNPGHVFAVWVCNGREYWIDPVPEIAYFDCRNLQPTYILDKHPKKGHMGSIGSLYDISGITVDFGRKPMAQTTIQLKGGKPSMATPAVSGVHWLDDMPGSEIGKFKLPKIQLDKVVKNVAHGMAVNTANAGKAIKKTVNVNAANAGKAIKKTVNVNAANAGKAIKKAANQQIHALKVNAANAGKFAVAVVGAPSRTAFLTLVRLNVFNMGVKMYKAGARDQNSGYWKELSAKWKNLGGDPNALHTAIKNGVGTHNKLHPKDHISGANYDGVAGYGDDMTIGEIRRYVYDPGVREVAGIYSHSIGDGGSSAGAALIAAAAPIIAALFSLLKRAGVDTTKAQDTAQAETQDLAADHNAAVDAGAASGDGTVTHSDGTETKTVTTANGQTALQIVHTPGATDGDQPGTDVDTTDNSGDKPANGAGNTLKEVMAKVKDHIVDHKWWYIGGAATALTLLLVVPAVRNRTKTVTKRRTR